MSSWEEKLYVRSTQVSISHAVLPGNFNSYYTCFVNLLHISYYVLYLIIRHFISLRYNCSPWRILLRVFYFLALKLNVTHTCLISLLYLTTNHRSPWSHHIPLRQTRCNRKTIHKSLTSEHNWWVDSKEFLQRSVCFVCVVSNVTVRNCSQTDFFVSVVSTTSETIWQLRWF